MNGKKSRVRRSGSEFSKYDSEGRVISSTSVTTEGEIVRHFYKYDSLGRRIHYEKHIVLDSNRTGCIFKEDTVYQCNGDIHKYSVDYKEKTISYNLINDMGRVEKTVCSNYNTGRTTEKIYNYRTGKYESTSYPELFLRTDYMFI